MKKSYITAAKKKGMWIEINVYQKPRIRIPRFSIISTQKLIKAMINHFWKMSNFSPYPSKQAQGESFSCNSIK